MPEKQVFGQIGSFAKPNTSAEVQWREVLSKVFQGFGKMVKLYDLEQLGQEMPFDINPLNL